MIYGIIIKNFATIIFLTIFSFGCATAWAQSEITVVHGEEDYPPMEMMVKGTFSGFHADIVNAVSAKLGIKIHWIGVPWKRALLMVEHGKADGITYIGKTPEREVWAIFNDDNIISSAKISFIVTKENASKIIFNGNISEFLKDRTLLVVRGFAFGDDKIDKAIKYESNSIETMVKMLLKQRYDVGILNWNDFSGAFKGKPEYQQLVQLSPPAIELNNYIAFSKAKKNEYLAKRFGEALKAFKKTPDYTMLLEKYGIEINL
nr:transporter substrate-binding domain-containing protein [Desulfobulbaceae bacterium]